MAFTPGGCRDLRKYMNDPAVMKAFGKLLTGRSNYMPVEERPQPRCPNCKTFLEGHEKFCPECGTKLEQKDEKAGTNENNFPANS
ncbi:MAG: zinc ribbon domain-containing protein [Candidatus Pacearchaeota archaeon]